MNTDQAGLINQDKTFQIIGCAMNVINGIGHGFSEKVYENALVVEFKSKNIPYAQQRRFKVLYKNQQVGEFIPDLIVFDDIIIDTKVIDKILEPQKGQMINYLRVSKIKTGLIINFKHSKLEWERVIL